MNDFARKHGYNPVEHVKGRLKSVDSIKSKLRKKNKEFTKENINKHVKYIVGVRIVCSFLSDVFDIVSVINRSPNIIVKQREDYIANPKDTGYMSYHMQVLVPVYLQDVEYVECELQIRTMAMDFWASLDHKLLYKFENDIPNDLKEKMFEYAKTIQELDKKMLDLNTIIQKYKKNI